MKEPRVRLVAVALAASSLVGLAYLLGGAIPWPGETGYWLVRGRLKDGAVVFEPLLLLPPFSEPTPSGGTYSLQVRDSAEAVLSETDFDPLNSIVDPGHGPDAALFFSVLARFNPAAASIVVLGPGQEVLGRVSIQGAPPAVAITSPATGAILDGTVEIAWSVDDSDGGSHSTWIEYSPDGGSRRIALATGTSRSSITVDFDKLPGCSDNCLLWIQTSDGVNTGSHSFSDFTVPMKGPSGAVIGPDRTVLAPGDLLWLQASAYDPEDGYLSGSSVQWTSSISGLLGEGDDLAIVGLAEGEHHVSATITDSDGNSVVDTFDVLVDGTEPSVQLSVIPDGLAARCVHVAFSASDEAGGSGLVSMRYSLDGGESWTDVSPSDPQRSFTVSGSGYFDLIVEAKDSAGNTSIEEETFFTSGECAASVGDFVLLGEQRVWVEQNAAALSVA